MPIIVRMPGRGLVFDEQHWMNSVGRLTFGPGRSRLYFCTSTLLMVSAAPFYAVGFTWVGHGFTALAASALWTGGRMIQREAREWALFTGFIEQCLRACLPHDLRTLLPDEPGAPPPPYDVVGVADTRARVLNKALFVLVCLIGFIALMLDLVDAEMAKKTAFTACGIVITGLVGYLTWPTFIRGSLRQSQSPPEASPPPYTDLASTAQLQTDLMRLVGIIFGATFAMSSLINCFVRLAFDDIGLSDTGVVIAAIVVTLAYTTLLMARDYYISFFIDNRGRLLSQQNQPGAPASTYPNNLGQGPAAEVSIEGVVGAPPLPNSTLAAGTSPGASGFLIDGAVTPQNADAVADPPPAYEAPLPADDVSARPEFQ